MGTKLRRQVEEKIHVIYCLFGIALLHRPMIYAHIKQVQKTNHRLSEKIARNTLMIFKDDRELEILLAYSLVENYKIEESRKLCLKLLEHSNDDNPFLHLIIGWTYIRSMQDGHLQFAEDARHHLEKVDVDQYRYRAERGLSLLYLLIGDHDMAVEFAESAYCRSPTPKYRAWLGKMIRRRDAASGAPRGES